MLLLPDDAPTAMHLRRLQVAAAEHRTRHDFSEVWPVPAGCSAVTNWCGVGLVAKTTCGGVRHGDECAGCEYVNEVTTTEVMLELNLPRRGEDEQREREQVERLGQRCAQP